MKRQHQIEFESVIDSIISDQCSVNKILCPITPGGGKSALPIITGKLISAGLVDKLLWVCPRMALQSQGERNFIDPFFRSMFAHNLSIRSSTNEPDPCRGLDGFITTYQAIAADAAKTVLNAFHKHRYAIILDEFHHLDLNGEWHRALSGIAAAAMEKVAKWLTRGVVALSCAGLIPVLLPNKYGRTLCSLIKMSCPALWPTQGGAF